MAANKKKRVDIGAENSPLTDNPFGGLGALKSQLPTAPAPPAAPKAEILEEVVVPYRVAKTRKGGWPVSFEKRAAGKLVTVIGNVSGDGAALLKVLRKNCATGGVLKDDVIELQGDHRGRVDAFLTKNLG